MARRWTLLTGDSVFAGEVWLMNRPGFTGAIRGLTWTLYWGEPEPGRTLPLHFVVNAIPHEAGHQVFGIRVRDIPVSSGTRYGSETPDWLDEAVAVWMESDSLQSARVDEIRGSAPVLATLLTMRHPSYEFKASDASAGAKFRVIERFITPPCSVCTWLPESLRTKFQVASTRLFADGRVEIVDEYMAEDPRGKLSFEGAHFYPLAYSLLLYIRTRGGTPAVRELINRYRLDPSPRPDVLNGLPGLPATSEAIQAAWHRFLRNIR